MKNHVAHHLKDKMMTVSLIDYTGSQSPDEDYAINLLIFTKNTRLQMAASGIADIASWSREKKIEELRYMANTIPSSWEFVDYTFVINGVSRAFTHQLVRTRTASFAQQTMRVLDVSEGQGWDYVTGPTIVEDERDAAKAKTRNDVYRNCMLGIANTYKKLIESGASVEDARGVLPTNIRTNIVVKMNMRTFVDMVRKRRSPRTQGEYRAVLSAMESAVLDVHPWVSLFINRGPDIAMVELDKAINEIEDVDTRTRMLKLVDQIRRG